MHQPPPSYLRIIFPKPGFFINDPRVRLTIDGRVACEQSFLQGFDWWTPIAPGFHYVELAIVTLITRSRMYSIEVRWGCSTEVVVGYSRLLVRRGPLPVWGNFGSSPESIFFRPL